MQTAVPEARSHLWHDAGFRLFATSRTLAWVGNTASAVALPVLVYQRTGSAALTGLMAAAESLPYLLLGMHVGALVDRRDGKRVMVVSALVTALALATVPLAEVLGVLSAAQLLLVALVGGISFVFLDAASFGTLPQLVGRQRIGAATASLTSVGTVVGIGVPGAVGVLLPLVGGVPIVGMDAVLCLSSALLLVGVRVQRGDEEGGPRPPSRLAADVKEGLVYIWRHPVIRPLTFLGFGNAFTGGAVIGLIVVVGVENLGFVDDDQRFGWIYAVAAFGSFLGATLLGRVQRLLPVGMITQVGYGLLILVIAAWATTSDWRVAAVLLCLEGVIGTLVILNGIVTRQTLTPMRLQGRVNTTARVIAWGGSPLGAAVGGVLAERMGVGPALYVCTVATLVSFVGGLWWRLPFVGRLSDLDEGSADTPVRSEAGPSTTEEPAHD